MRGLLNIVGIEYLVDREKDEHLTKARTAAAQRAALQQDQLKSTRPIDWQAYAQVRKTHSCFARHLAIHPESLKCKITDLMLLCPG